MLNNQMFRPGRAAVQPRTFRLFPSSLVLGRKTKREPVNPEAFETSTTFDGFSI
jgi:hypothetical protein